MHLTLISVRLRFVLIFARLLRARDRRPGAAPLRPTRCVVAHWVLRFLCLLAACFDFYTSTKYFI